MIDIGYSKYQYQIPGFEEWYIILTSNNYHFYFNKSAKKSYWQLSDVFDKNVDIEQEKFIEAIDFNQISLLTALNNGLSELKIFGEEIARELVQEDTVEDNHHNRDKNCTEASQEDISRSEEEVELDDELNKDAANEFIANLLKEEGYIKDSELKPENEPENERGTTDSVPMNSGLLTGYTSSDEDEEDEESENEKNEENLIEKEEKNFHADDDDNDQDKNSESDNENINEGLDLSLSDEEINQGIDLSLSDNEDSESKKAEFMNLLNIFKDRISIFDSWSMVEEELIQEFIKFPEYYAISNSSDREILFNNWCSTQSEETLPEVESSTSPSILYYRFLQEHKADVKSLYYKEFLNRTYNDSSHIDLSPKEKERLFTIFKMMIMEFSQYERKIKKSKSYDSKINLKQQKLEDFLSEKFAVHKPIVTKSELKLIEDAEQPDSFHKWIKLCNTFSIPDEIAEDPINFVVGDDKRLKSYLNAFSQFVQ